MELIQPVVDTIKLLWDPTARRVNYFTKIGENNDNLQNQVKELTNSRDDLKSKLERAAREGKVPTNVVRDWLKEADKIIKKAEDAQTEFQQNKKCFYGWCLDCCSRYKLGRSIVKATKHVQDHKAKRDEIGDEIAVPPPPEPVLELPTTTIREGTSTMGTLDQVWNWLMDAKTGIIGIWGKGGVGKTTLVKNINNKLHNELPKHFEVVIFVTVSRNCNIKKLRNDIGKEIGEEFGKEISAEQDERRASVLLFNKLKGKRFLLILDDMWEKVDLEKLGVPAPKEHGCCKIVITTRNKGVCNDTETNEEIMVEVLSETDAWELFKEKAGSVISSDLEPIARDVCKECRGLPLAIIVVGRALRRKTGREVWQNALEMLKSAQFKLRGMHDEVYSPLKFSYDHLTTDNLRNCFLYCSLFPEDYRIDVDHLIEYWTMEGFIEEADISLKRVSEMGHSLLEELIDSSLLEKYGDYSVTMHDMIRDMAIKITSKSTERGRRFLVQAGLGLKECPEVGKWEEKDRISLMENDIQSLPDDEPKCTELSSLLLQWNEFLKEIPQSFFKQMKNLRVLDLSGTRVVSLPPSISELGQLQLLDLAYTFIAEIPHEIGQLTSLRRLNLSCTLKLACIPADMIRSLSLLEDLEMWKSSYFLTSSFSDGNKLIEEVGHLTRLTHFSASITNELCKSSECKFLLSRKLKSFDLVIEAPSSLHRRELYMLASIISSILAGTRPSLPKRGWGRYLGITDNQEAFELLQFAEILHLQNQEKVRTISSMGADNLKWLKECRVSECQNMENIITTEEAEGGILPNLEILDLFNLPNLRSIWEGNGTPGSFGSIKNISLSRCDNVMHLFSSNVLQLLNSLQELNITTCGRMVEIVTGEVGNGVIALPMLRRIVLKELPELNRMWEGVLSLESLQAVEVTSCPSLRQLPIDIEKTPALEVIKGESEWWGSLEWQNDSNKSHFKNKFEATHIPNPI